jgi:predicted acyltransferase
LYGYWFLQTLVPIPDQHGAIGALLLDRPDAVLSAWLDRTVLGLPHLWVGSKTWDPEGILSTIPAIGTVILGVFTGRWITRKDQPIAERLNAMFVVGALAMMVGLMWNWVFPINKSLWTSSFVMFTGGMAAVTLAGCIWLVDVKEIRWWTKPFVIYGMNPILAFVGSGVLARIIYTLVQVPYGGRIVSLETAIYESVFHSWLEPRNASVAFAICVVLFWFGILTVLYRRKIFLKV